MSKLLPGWESLSEDELEALAAELRCHSHYLGREDDLAAIRQAIEDRRPKGAISGQLWNRVPMQRQRGI